MSTKVQSLGSAGSAVAGILITSGTNATPIVATVTAGHGLKNGDRIAIAGVTGLTAMNGVWTLGSVGATTATLLGSVGNGAFGGTAVVGVVFDKTPFMKGHAATLQMSGVALVGTMAIRAFASYADFALATQANPGGAEAPVQDPAWTNTAGNATTTPASSTLVATAAAPINTTELKCQYIMQAVCTAFTSGVMNPRIVA
jgi:hypothetical protein